MVNPISKLIAMGDNNPVIKGLLQKIKTPEEAEALIQTLNKQKANTELKNVMKNTDLPINQAELFDPNMVRSPKVVPSPEEIARTARAKDLHTALPPAPMKSAADSADVFNQGQNFDMIGLPKTDPNFRVVGKPYGTNYPTAAIKEPNLPIQRSASGVPAALQANEAPVMDAAFREVSEAAAPAVEQKILSAADEGAEAVSKGMSGKAKLGVPAVLGGAALLSLQGDTDSNQQAPERKEASAEVVQEKPKAVAPSKAKTDTNDEEETDESDVTPSQKVQAEARQPEGESEAPQKQEPIPSYLNFENRGQDQNELNKLLDAQREEVRNQKILESIAMIGGNLAGAPPDRQVYKDAIAASGLPIEQYKIKQANEPNDPNSGISQGMRDYMKKLGVNVSENATAAQIQSVLPMAFKEVEAKQAQEAKSADLQNRLEVAQKMKEASIEQSRTVADQRKQDKQEVAVQKKEDELLKRDILRLDKLNHELTPGTASGRSAFGIAAKNYQTIDNALALLEGELDPNTLDTAQVYEANKILDRVLSGTGGATISGTEHLSQPTAVQDFAKIKTWWTNKRQAAGAGDFIKTQIETLKREARQAQKQMRITQDELLGGKDDLRKRRPQEIFDILKRHKIPWNSLDEKASSQKDKYPPGSTVKVKGKLYTVAPNGDDLVPQ